MGTNYYVVVRPGEACPNPCKHCRHQAEDIKIHLGKSSGGWKFLHRSYVKVDDIHGPEGLDFPVTDRKSWLKLLDLGPIENEYGVPETKEGLLAYIESKQHMRGHESIRPSSFLPDETRFIDQGYDFCDAEFC